MGGKSFIVDDENGDIAYVSTPDDYVDEGDVMTFTTSTVKIRRCGK